MPQSVRLKPRRNDDERTVRACHDVDLFTWVQEQVALLRTGKVGEIDAANIAEELSDVGAEQYDKLECALAVLLQHLLKWDHQPKRRSRSWDNTIAEQRRRIQRILKKNPGLKSHLDEAIEEGYQDGRDRASTETNIDRAAFPAACPYSFPEIMKRPIAYADNRTK